MNERALAALAVVMSVWAILSDWFARHDLNEPFVFMSAGLLAEVQASRTIPDAIAAITQPHGRAR